MMLSEKIKIPKFLFQKNCILLNNAFETLFIPKEIEKLFKYESENYKIFYKDLFLNKIEVYKTIFENSEGFHNVEFVFLNADNQPIVLLINGFKYCNDNEEIYVLFYNNITEVKNYQRKYYTKEIELNTLIYKISLV